MDPPPLLRQRRESIDDHLAAARRRFPELRVAKFEGSRSFVRDLIRRGFMDELHDVPKSQGPGRGRRFAPRDYRTLLEIMRLRADGHAHGSRWMVWLWLRGQDFPPGEIRDALQKEVGLTLEIMRSQLNPSGRATESFHTSYQRNVVPTREDSPFPDLGGLEEPLAALMMRPHEAATSPIDIDSIAAFVADQFGADPATMLAAIRDVSSNPALDFSSTAERLASALPEGPLSNMVRNIAYAGESPLPLAHLAGMLDDGAGRSALLTALAKASDDDLQVARREIQRLRTGELEREIERIPIVFPDADRDELAFASGWARMQRAVHRGNPAFAGYLVAIYVHCNSDPIPVGDRRTTNVNELLKALRSMHQQEQQ